MYRPYDGKLWAPVDTAAMVYVKSVVAEGETIYAIHDANGRELGRFDDLEHAKVAAWQNDLVPMSVH